MDNWDQVKAPVGLFFTWGGQDDLSTYDYLTMHSMELWGRDNLYEKWMDADHGSMPPHRHIERSEGAKKFHILFVN
jgi:hypothetical protein